MKYLLAVGLLGSAIASPHARPAPQDQQEIDPEPSLTYSSRVTDLQTQNGNSSSTSSSTKAPATTASPSLTEIAAFTAPNGGIFTATAIDGVARIAGHVLTIGGAEALVGNVRVSAASDGLKFGASMASYATVTGSSTVQVVSTATDEQGSATVVSSTETVAVAETSGAGASSATGSESESASASSSSASASASGSAASTGVAAAVVPAVFKASIASLAGIAVVLCLMG